MCATGLCCNKLRGWYLLASDSVLREYGLRVYLPEAARKPGRH
jgi:hypothetical protein